jgi:uncharacterized protein YndB with AHSA1/START domain
MSAVANATESEDRTLIITRIFDAPRPRVFQAFSDKRQYAQWMGPKNVRVIECEQDFRKGGKYRTVLRSEEGNTHILVGEFREVVPNERLVFSWAWESGGSSGPETTVTIEFRDHEDGTEISLTQSVFEALETRDHHARGWEGSFDCLAEHLG